MTNKRNLLIMLFSTFVLMLSFSTVYYFEKYKTEVKNNDNISLKITEYKKENEKLKVENAKLKGEMEVNKEILNVVSKYKEYFGIDTELVEYLDKAKEISEATPLDFDTAMIVLKYAKKYDLKPSLILSMIDHESNFNRWEVGKAQDRGYMQIIPSTEKWLAEDYGKKLGIEYNPDKIFDPEYNIGLAAVYLSILKNAYGNDYNRILSEYNRGPYGLARYYAKNQTYETSYSKVILRNEKKYVAFN